MNSVEERKPEIVWVWILSMVIGRRKEGNEMATRDGK